MQTSCIACGQRLNLFGTADGVMIFHCSNCGLGATHPRGVKTRYTKYHRDALYKASIEQFSNIFQKRVDIISKFKESGGALEIGSSTGLLLSLLKVKGWTVLGIEPSTESAAYAQKMGIETVTKIFEQVKLAKESFDLVVFNHTLEHIHDPSTVIAKARGILKEDGLIFIDVPNFGSLTAKLMGAKWPYILPREHYWHFTKDSLFRLLEKSGFQPIYWEAHSGIWGYGNPLKEILDSFIGRKKRFFWNMATALPTWAVSILGYGTGLTVVAKKS